jgi:hypothetical protein
MAGAWMSDGTEGERAVRHFALTHGLSTATPKFHNRLEPASMASARPVGRLWMARLPSKFHFSFARLNKTAGRRTSRTKVGQLWDYSDPSNGTPRQSKRSKHGKQWQSPQADADTLMSSRLISRVFDPLSKHPPAPQWATAWRVAPQATAAPLILHSDTWRPPGPTCEILKHAAFDDGQRQVTPLVRPLDSLPATLKLTT